MLEERTGRDDKWGSSITRNTTQIVFFVICMATYARMRHRVTEIYLQTQRVCHPCHCSITDIDQRWRPSLRHALATGIHGLGLQSAPTRNWQQVEGLTLVRLYCFQGCVLFDMVNKTQAPNALRTAQKGQTEEPLVRSSLRDCV